MAELQVQKAAVLLNKGEVQAIDWMDYLKKNWKELTTGLHNATILILAGRHGDEHGSIGPTDKFIMFNHQGLVCSLKIQTTVSLLAG